MLSKRISRARIALACALLPIAGCQSALNRAVNEQSERSEVNASFVIERNLLRLNTVTIDGKPGRFFIGSAHPRTLLSNAFAGSTAPRRSKIRLSDGHSVDVEPLATDLAGVGEAIVGIDAWRSRAISINYVAGILTVQDSGTPSGEMTVFSFRDVPQITVTVNGTAIKAIVDTTSPDTLTLPRAEGRGPRAEARVEIAGVIFPNVDVAFSDTSQPRVGNRLLSKFLVTIDYGRRQVALWRDPRVPIE